MEAFSSLPWDHPGWFDRVEGWVEAELGRLGLVPQEKLELVRTRPWAAVARVATDSGEVWFKEAAPPLSFEPSLTVAVAARAPAFAPEVLAAEGASLLTRDAGPRLRSLLESGEPAPAWEDILPRYAELQIELAGAVDELLALGAPDRRPAVVSAGFVGLVDRVHRAEPAKANRLRPLASELALLAEAIEGPLPFTLIHEEVHEGNVFVRDGHARLLDWGEAAVSHPYAGLVNTLRDIAYRQGLEADAPEILRLRSVYLEPWTRFAPAPELEEIFARGYLLGTLCRAMSWDRILTSQLPPVRAEYGRNAEVWLEIFREGLENGVRLGAS
jgi:Ser/Thr protein kinase RdoA (MazF antagonist)